MAPLKSQPAVSSQRHELLDVIQSLTQQLQKADEAVVTLKAQAQTQVSSLESELANTQAKLAERNKGREDLLEQLSVEKTLRKEAEHQLAIARQSQLNAERESEHHRNTLSLSDKIHGSSTEQLKREAQDWKDQCARIELTREAQAAQIEELLKALRNFMAKSQHTYDQVPQRHVSTLPPTTIRHVGPLVSVPLIEPRIKTEEFEEQYQEDDTPEDANGASSSRSFNKSRSRIVVSASASEEDTRPPSSPRKRRATKADKARKSYVEIEEEEDDEMAIGYEERQTARTQFSPSGQPKSPQTPYPKGRQKDDHRRSDILAVNDISTRPQHPRYANAYLSTSQSQLPSKTPIRHAIKKTDGGGSNSGSVASTRVTGTAASAKKRKVLHPPDENDDIRARNRR